MRHPHLRSQLRMITLSWVFGSLWLWTISGAVMTRFAREMGTPDWAFGLLAALPFLGTLFQLPASYLLDHHAGRKRLFLAVGIPSRLLWIVIAAIPWWLPGRHDWWFAMMIMTLAVTWATHNMGVPAWMNWMADVIPIRLRGRYFAVRRNVSYPVALIVTLGLGWALDVITKHHGPWMLRFTSTVLMVAGVFGLMDIICFAWVHDPHQPPAQPTGQWLRKLLTPLRQREFRCFVAFSFSFALATGYMGQYIWLYLFDAGQMSNLWANILLMAVPGLASIPAYTLWGRLIDRHGRKPVLIIAVLGLVTAPIGWVTMIGGQAPWAYAIALFGMISFSGVDMATTNIMVNFAGRRDDDSSGTAMVAVNSIAMAVGGMLSGLISALVAKSLIGFQWTVPVVNVSLSYHALLLLLSAALRGLSLLWILGMPEVQAAPTRDVIRYMTASLYGNVRQALLMPTRVVGQIYRRSYPLKFDHRDAIENRRRP